MRNFSTAIYISSCFPTNFSDFGFPIEWEMSISVDSSDASLTDLTQGDSFFANVFTEELPPGSFTACRYDIKEIRDINWGIMVATAVVTWSKYNSPQDPTYENMTFEPMSYSLCLAGSNSDLDEVMLPASNSYNITDLEKFVAYCRNINNIAISKSIMNRIPEKTGMNRQPVIFNGENIFTLNQSPISSTIKFEVNNIQYNDKCFNYDLERNQVEWVFTENLGGFDLDNRMDINIVYEYVVK